MGNQQSLSHNNVNPASSMGSTSSSPTSLYSRLGGIYPIAAVVDSFSDKLYADRVVGVNSPNPQLRDWHRNQHTRLPGLKWMRTLWVSAVAGGPYKFIPSTPQRQGTCPFSGQAASIAGGCPFSLNNAHMQLEITPEEFDAVVAVLKTTLDEFNIPQQEQSEVLAAFASHKIDVTQGSLM